MHLDTATGQCGGTSPPVEASLRDGLIKLGFQGIIIMWQLVFALCHRLKYKKKKIQEEKRVPDCYGDPSELGHGKNIP